MFGDSGSASRALQMVRRLDEQLDPRKRIHTDDEEEFLSECSSLDESASDSRERRRNTTHSHKRHHAQPNEYELGDTSSSDDAPKADDTYGNEIDDPLNSILVSMSEKPLSKIATDTDEALFTSAVSGQMAVPCIFCVMMSCEAKLTTAFPRFNRVLQTAGMSKKVNATTINSMCISNIIVDIQDTYNKDAYALVRDEQGRHIDIRFPASDTTLLSKRLDTHLYEHDLTPIGDNYRKHDHIQKCAMTFRKWQGTNLKEIVTVALMTKQLLVDHQSNKKK